MKSILLVTFLSLAASFAHAEEFKPFSTPSFRQFGAITISRGFVDVKEALEVRYSDGRKVHVISVGKSKTFNDAQKKCSDKGKKWNLPSSDDAYAFGFMDLFSNEVNFEIDIRGKEVHPYWFVDSEGENTSDNLKGTDKFISFFDGGGPSGSPVVQSLSSMISQMSLPSSIDSVDKVTPEVALALVLRGKLEQGIPVYCLDGKLLD
ncbi:MAG: hypothetical protein H6625_11740 [Bdellovibrionaceae bacterium]|nr:hypothetical protein [Pseudobdellovibrionaceae bacterium]